MESKSSQAKSQKEKENLKLAQKALYGQGKASQMVTQVLVLKPDAASENKKT